MKIDWKAKLTSRKFWAAVIGVITTLLVAFNVPNLTIEQVVAVISTAATLIAYILGEGMVDAARAKAENPSGKSDGESKAVTIVQNLAEPVTATRAEVYQQTTNRIGGMEDK